MKRLILVWIIVLAIVAVALAQFPENPGGRRRDPRTGEEESPRLPDGRSQRDAIAKADYEDNLKDAAELRKLAEGLQQALEKDGQHVVSINSIHDTERIEKLAKNIRNRLKRL
jgi:hypothetical protein